ncbi:PucR family transcriptional regulator [Mycolicibacterium confluentis]|uniref:Putative regulatory protein n=1 Tax=Mycolicibacterium confluentis TaxID=28047 RepID=A0A7I7XTP8_9MYCO|nr:PucR family transcriptional regulator [Mycolicibacterium confluentis]MCV7320968.1 PucR family transcriptional regulator ligand-binding domain-containing protein [Mycolicibacterium confluentis]ORV27002.1 PucR family transcriptional regulator [Mycolicibacterium confluentis]BBZ32628.1 putative regulatory protein [Mycolicibacterium confluentis]
MEPTLKEILALPVLQAGQPEVVLGDDEALGRRVRWVHVSELSDLSNLLEGGELVLTTGLALTDGRLRDGYLPGLAAAGAVGVVVELGLHVDEVPASVLAAGADLGMAVVALHRPVRFVEVTEEVHRRIVADQYAEVDYARRAHETFTALSMRRASLDEIVRVAADMLSAPLVLEDLNRKVLAYAGHGMAAPELLGDWERRSRLNPDAGPQAWLSRRVGPYRQEWGRLIAPTLTETSRVVMTIERAAQALALHRMVEQDRMSLELRAQSGLVDDLRHGRVRDEAEATSRAHALGLRPSLAYVPMTVRLADSKGPDQVVVQQRRVRTLDAVVHAVRSRRHTVLAAAREDGVIDLLLAPRHSVPGADSEAVLDELCLQIREVVKNIDGVNDCVIGVGPESTRLVEAAGGLAEADHVAEVAVALLDSGRSFYRAADVRLRGLLALVRTDPRVQAFAETELRSVLADRAKHGDDMFELLQTYLEVGGNKTELAKRLHLSRPTLYARLAALQRMLGVDLEDAESRTSLHVAMLILQR